MTLSTPQHKPRSVSAYGRRRTSMGSSHTVSDFQQVKHDRNDGNNVNIESIKLIYFCRYIFILTCNRIKAF